MTPKNLLREYTDQFDKSTCRRIKKLIDSLDKIKLRSGSYTYQIFELKRALYAGLLLSALNLAFALAELFVRDLAISSRYKERIRARRNRGIAWDERTMLNKLELELEDDKRATLPTLVEEVAGTIISTDDIENIKRVYKEIRIPLAHGLVWRLVAQKHVVFKYNLEDTLGLPPRSQAFEDAVEGKSLETLEFLIGFIVKYQPFSVFRRPH